MIIKETQTYGDDKRLPIMLKTIWDQNRLEVKQPELYPVYLAFVQLEENAQKKMLG